MSKVDKGLDKSRNTYFEINIQKCDEQMMSIVLKLKLKSSFKMRGPKGKGNSEFCYTDLAEGGTTSTISKIK